MFGNEWVVAGLLVAVLAVGLLLPRRGSKNQSNADKENRGKLS